MSYSDSADDNLWISPKYRAEDWRQLDLTHSDSVDWFRAVDILYDRINGRFLAPVKAIEKNSDPKIRWFSGFTIVAIDCLIIETLYQFYNGVDETNIEHKKAFWCFFKQSPHFKTDFPYQEVAYKFYSHFRCGILHQAQTKMKSKIKIGQAKMVQLSDPKDINQGLIVDREKFHKALCHELKDYMDRLKAPKSPEDYTLREHFQQKMSFIVM